MGRNIKKVMGQPIGVWSQVDGRTFCSSVESSCSSAVDSESILIGLTLGVFWDWWFWQ